MTTVQVPTSEQARLDAISRIIQAYTKLELHEEKPNILKAAESALDDLFTLGVIGSTEELTQ